MSSYYTQTSYSKRCSCKPVRLFFYHLAGLLALGGLIVLIVGFATQWLFTVRIYDLRRMTFFEQIEVTVGLFSSTGLMQKASEEWTVLEKPLHMSYLRWTLGQFFGMIALLATVTVIVVHICACVMRGVKEKPVVIAEVTCMLVALSTLMICIGLAESEIYFLHDYGDAQFFDMLRRNSLMPSDPQQAARVNYDLFMSRPQRGYWVLAAADFTFLAAFLGMLPHLIVLCKPDEFDQPLSAKARNRDQI